jgi:hypothetical protein
MERTLYVGLVQGQENQWIVYTSAQLWLAKSLKLRFYRKEPPVWHVGTVLFTTEFGKSSFLIHRHKKKVSSLQNAAISTQHNHLSGARNATPRGRSVELAELLAEKTSALMTRIFAAT